MNMKHDEKIIHNMYEKINTPEYDATHNVLSRINSAPRKKFTLKKVIIAAAVVGIIGAAVGAVELIDWQRFDLFGNRVIDENVPASTPVANMQNADPFSEQDNIFVSEAKLGESRIVALQDSSGSTSGTGSFNSDDFDALAAYAHNADSPLSLPTYIPEGYVFKTGRIQFYLDTQSLDAEVIFSEVKDGKTFEIYKLPEGYDKNIECIRLEYAGPGGDKLTFEARLAYALDENTSFSHGAPESAVASKIDITGFDSAILIHDAKKNNFYLNIAALYREIPEIDAVFSLADALHPSEHIHNFDEEAYMHNFSAMIITIDAENLSEEEVIKIAESIK